MGLRSRLSPIKPRGPASSVGDRVLRLETELRTALDRDELRLAFQPIVALSDRAITGVEALLRWQHPVHGVIPPMRFIPAAESSGLIVPIGAWVLRRACHELSAWDHDDLTVSVNVSAPQLVTGGFLDAVVSALDDSAVPPHRLCLEITETAVLADPATTRATLQALTELGVRLAVDDFGVGHASLRHLRSLLPVDALKIDKSFVAGVTVDRADAAIVQAVVQMAHALGLQAVAEGIETAEQAELLTAWGCEGGQGYFFGRPVEASEIATLVARPILPVAPAPPATAPT